MNNELTISEVKQDELDELETICKTSYIEAFSTIIKRSDIQAYIDAAYNKETLLSALKCAESVYSFLMVEGQKAGYIEYALTKNAVHLKRIYILSAFKNRGLGSQALGWLKQLGVTNHKKELALEVLHANKAAIAFYEKHGFKTSSAQSIAIGKRVYQLDSMSTHIS